MAHRGWLAAGIRSVIDLRNGEETRRRETDPPLSAEAAARFGVVLAPTEDPGNSEFRKICGPYLNNPAFYADNARLFPEMLAGVFKALAAAQGGVVIHCSAGRDRSGMIAAMLQDLAGHSDEAIVLGYQCAMRGINEYRRTAATPHPYERYLPEEVLLPLLELHGGSLLAFVRSLNTKDFLQRHGVTVQELRAIVGKLSR
jgi:hypothetical protein